MPRKYTKYVYSELLSCRKMMARNIEVTVKELKLQNNFIEHCTFY